MQKKLILLVMTLGSLSIQAATNDLAASVQKGLFEEEANHNFDAAIRAYESAIGNFDSSRSLAATAIFRLGEVYRKLGRTNEANLQYQRILREFSDQAAYTNLSQTYVGSASVPISQNVHSTADAKAERKMEEMKEIERLKRAFAESPDLINAGDPQTGSTPLHKAASQGQIAVVEFLLTNSANVNVKDSSGRTPLYAAVDGNQKEVVDLLIKAGADVNDRGPNPDPSGHGGKMLLHLAAERAYKPIVESLLTAGANPNARSSRGFTPLHFAVASGFKGIVEALLAKGADPNVSTDYRVPMGNEQLTGTPLEFAVIRNYPTIAELLLVHGADPNQIDSNGDTALHFAASRERKDLMALLLKHGGKPNIMNRARETPLFNAVRANDTELVKALLVAGADVDHRDQSGRTPLHNAAEAASNFDSSKVISLLLGSGAKVNAQTELGMTPLGMLLSRVQENNHSQIGGSGAPVLNSQQAKAVKLLEEHGGREQLPDFKTVRLTRNGLRVPSLSLQADTNGFNRFTLFELLARHFAVGGGQLLFPDPSSIRIIRSSKQEPDKQEFLSVNALDATDIFDCKKDMPLEFGDTVEIPQREHALSDPPTALTSAQAKSLRKCVERKVKFIIKGQTIESSLDGIDFGYLSNALRRSEVQSMLRTTSDLSRVKVKRVDPSSKETKEIFENVTPFWNGHMPAKEDLWLQDGDIIEVPEKQ
jgi:ankyrin repeat protein